MRLVNDIGLEAGVVVVLGGSQALGELPGGWDPHPGKSDGVCGAVSRAVTPVRASDAAYNTYETSGVKRADGCIAWEQGWPFIKQRVSRCN